MICQQSQGPRADGAPDYPVQAVQLMAVPTGLQICQEPIQEVLNGIRNFASVSVCSKLDSTNGNIVFVLTKQQGDIA